MNAWGNAPDWVDRGARNIAYDCYGRPWSHLLDAERDLLRDYICRAAAELAAEREARGVGRWWCGGCGTSYPGVPDAHVCPGRPDYGREGRLN